MHELQHTPEHVMQYAKEGRLEEWIHAFLLGPGNNEGLSTGLRLQERFWIGPLELPLSRLSPAAGPDEGYEYVMPRDPWERRVSCMQESLREGWQAPPLILSYGENGDLSIRDGNHRYWALTREGVGSHWCIIWCNSEAEYREALVALGR
ncbi:MAG TPA: chromosome partitioning protein ParB [Symbiobacteriaceae bacterium]|nr:chromosome partitioning protein ParB [Symbiobacteriaceae bacterium]